MVSQQPDMFAEPGPSAPPGLLYRPDFLSLDEEQALADWLADLPFQPFQFRGFEGRRRVVSFGWKYAFNRSSLQKVDDIPAQLLPVRARAAEFAGLRAFDLQQVVLNEYLPGVPVGWRRDRPMFAEIVGISLLNSCVFRFR